MTFCRNQMIRIATRLTIDFWVQGRKKDGIPAGQSDRTANKIVQQFKEIGHLIFTSTSALSLGILKQRRGKCTIDFCEHGAPVSNSSVNQLGVYAAVTCWCHQFGLTEEEKEKVAFSVNNGVMTMVEPEEVGMLVSLPNSALGHKMQGIESFPTLEERTNDTFMRGRLNPASVTAGNRYQNPAGSDEKTDFCFSLCEIS